MQVTILDHEAWYGGTIDDGWRMPFAEGFRRHLVREDSTNQVQPLLVSNKGRWIWSELPFRVRVERGLLLIEDAEGPLEWSDGHGDLAGACRSAQSRCFPPTGALPAEELFTKPQYNTWIELQYDQAEIPILRYADAILAQGFPTGVLMIDDTWQDAYGVWEFNPGRFRDPKGMVQRLHDQGFQVMLWVCPFVSPDTAEFRACRDAGLLIRDAKGDPAIRAWWNGYSAVLDMTNPDAVAWLGTRLERLQTDYGVDGFKLDAGDAGFYRDTDQAHVAGHPGIQSEAWARFGLRWPLNEYRACWRLGGQALGQRLRDKNHSWGVDGLASCIPNALAMGLMGYPFLCPDMIGGGEYYNFRANSDKLEPELFVRWAQVAALFPMMQFSAAPWRLLPAAEAALCRAAAELHLAHAADILTLAKHAAATGEPIMRHLEWAYPGQGFQAVNDQFLLGDRLLVAPVVTKGARRRSVHLPKGQWTDELGNRFTGGTTIEIEAPLERLPRFKLQE